MAEPAVPSSSAAAGPAHDAGDRQDQDRDPGVAAVSPPLVLSHQPSREHAAQCPSRAGSRGTGTSTWRLLWHGASGTCREPGPEQACSSATRGDTEPPRPWEWAAGPCPQWEPRVRAQQPPGATSATLPGGDGGRWGEMGVTSPGPFVLACPSGMMWTGADSPQRLMELGAVWGCSPPGHPVPTSPTPRGIPTFWGPCADEDRGTWWGAPRFAPPLGVFGSKWGWCMGRACSQGDGDPVVPSPQGTSSTAWLPPATTRTRSGGCRRRRHRRTQPTPPGRRSTATPRAPSPASPPATSTGRRR